MVSHASVAADDDDDNYDSGDKDDGMGGHL